MRDNVIVIGGNHHNTLGVIRSLGYKGIKSDVILVTNCKRNYVEYSKYISSCIKVSTYAQAINVLSNAAFHNSVVIACSDGVSSAIDLNFANLEKTYRLPGIKEQGRITYLMNKDTMANLAVDCGINVPRSWVIETQNFDAEVFNYPCIVKPLASIAGSKSDIFICANKDELVKNLEKIDCNRVQIQEYIDKKIEFQLIGCSLSEGETVIIPGASVILRQPKNTNTGFLKYIPKRDFQFNEEVCRRFLKATRYSGLFSMEFLRGKDGKDYFMEINFRNDGNAICVTASGMNLPYIWYLYNSGQPYEDELCYDKMKEVIVMPEFDDFANVKNRSLSIIRWLKDVMRTDCFMEFSKYDQKPFWQKLKTLVLVHSRIDKNVEFS